MGLQTCVVLFISRIQHGHRKKRETEMCRNRKKKNIKKTLDYIDVQPLIRNMTTLRSSVTILTELTEFTRIWYQLYNTNCFSDCDESRIEYTKEYTLNALTLNFLFWPIDRTPPSWLNGKDGGPSPTCYLTILFFFCCFFVITATVNALINNQWCLLSLKATLSSL